VLNIANKIPFHRFRGLKDFDLWHEKNVWLGEYHDWSSSRRIDREKVGDKSETDGMFDWTYFDN
jgi:hypothetical protein